MHRFCSRACVNKLTGDDNNSQDLTPSSLSISASSQTMVIDLAQRDQEDNPTPNCNIPDTIVHRVTPNTTDPIWTVIHELEKKKEIQSHLHDMHENQNVAAVTVQDRPCIECKISFNSSS
ncbi:hypothetical protein F441_22939 [Phytophthora nicotianae CJ01A1]|uniref:Uncharacterized protein n=2 Tax=Phytophthora nicotianae TaxID=4792 RepID=W2VN91_PHYNI|nr:hypothetical protein L915_21985 [Phytophthora nicotianae]ETO99645.1 hypothetical protein F441_22939 [Phytophthora nicotianae CJ01A1]